MATINFRQLIDLAIGTPEPGHVNFYALHCLLYSFAEELNIIEKNVDCTKYGNISMIQSDKTASELELSKKTEQQQQPESIPVEEVAGGEPAASSPPKETPAPKETPTAATSSKEPDDGYKLLEFTEDRTAYPEMDILQAHANLRSLVEMAVDEVMLLGAMMIEPGKNTTTRMATLRNISNELRSKQPNGPYQIARGDDERSWHGSEQDEEQSQEEEGDEIETSVISHNTPPSFSRHSHDNAQEQYDLDLHLCYAPEKLLDQLLELKSEFCQLTNKVNEISATILEQDCQRTTLMLQELQEQMREVKYFTASLKDMQELMESKMNRSSNNIDSIYKTLHELMEEKIDKGEIDVLLADKVDYKQLQRKVSHEQIQEVKCQLERQFCEMHRLMNANEKNMHKVIEELRITLGYDSIDKIIQKFKDKIDLDLQALQETLRKYIESTNDECAAAGARIKVLQDLACLSCDTTCVMRTMEKAKVPKMSDAHATNFISPLITYELGSIRKSGLMGYYRKDDAHAPHAWLKGQSAPLKACVPRHAGGAHTTSTAKERVEKVLLNKK